MTNPRRSNVQLASLSDPRRVNSFVDSLNAKFASRICRSSHCAWRISPYELLDQSSNMRTPMDGEEEKRGKRGLAESKGKQIR